MLPKDSNFLKHLTKLVIFRWVDLSIFIHISSGTGFGEVIGVYTLG